VSENSAVSARQLRELYERNVNIMAWFREMRGEQFNSCEAIRISYDLQSGSYVRALESEEHRCKLELYARAVADVLDALPGSTLLEAGVGEATTLCEVLRRSGKFWSRAAGFDLAWSRIAVARSHAASIDPPPQLFTGNLFHIPVCTASFDIVFTSHAIEPNHGRETEALRELARISRHWVVLCEPSYELGNAATRARVEEHGYCRGLPEAAIQAGLKVVEHRLLDTKWSESNQTGLLILERLQPTEGVTASFLACPVCGNCLESLRGNLFCTECLKAYPVLDGIPCLLSENGILASKFTDAKLFP
jgi:uncharacterized protein YbaR (Trm112 family)